MFYGRRICWKTSSSTEVRDWRPTRSVAAAATGLAAPVAADPSTTDSTCPPSTCAGTSAVCDAPNVKCHWTRSSRATRGMATYTANKTITGNLNVQNRRKWKIIKLQIDQGRDPFYFFGTDSKKKNLTVSVLFDFFIKKKKKMASRFQWITVRGFG